MLACLVTLRPLLSGTTKRAAINLCSVADRRVTAMNGIAWEPAITQAPAIGMQFWNGDFEQGTDAGKIDFTFNLEQARKAFPLIINAVWMGAIVEVALGVIGKPDTWKTRFIGRVTGYAGSEYPAMKISASVDTEPFNVDVLPKTYAGTGDAEGGEDLKEKVKPLALGRPHNVEPVLINAVNSVYQFSAYGPIERVEVLYERASAFPAASANYATYAELVAGDIKPGHWATCLTEGLIRLGAPAAGVITADIRGHAVAGVAPRGAGALVRVMADISGVAPALLSLTKLAALDAEGATNSDIMVTEQVSFLEAVRRLILPCNWQVVVTNLGVLLPMKPVFDLMTAMTVHVQGRRAPLVSASTEEAVSVPYFKTTMAAARSWRVHTLDEIASDVTLIDRGDYNSATVYRAGNIVKLPGGSRWEYISDNPQAGITPGTDPAVWATMEVSGRYSDGTFYDDLQPAEAGATEGAPSGTPVGDKAADDVASTVKDGGGVADGQVATPAIVDNAVSESNFSILELYGASVGTDDDNIWRNFAYAGVSLDATFNNPVGGSDATASFDVTVAGVRTGGDNDRISIRVIRDDGAICMPSEWSNLLFESGGQQSYNIPFFDPDPPVGTSVYTVQTKNLTGHPAWQRGVIRPLRLSK